MQVWEIVLVALGVSADACAVAMCKGVEMKKFVWKYALVIAACFGLFQVMMPLIGWVVASQFAGYITEWDHWVAFGLLVLLGAKMIFDSFKKEKPLAEGEEPPPLRLGVKSLLVMSVATSIDALAVGVSFAFLEVNIALALAIIGSFTFVISVLGVLVGVKIGNRFKNKAEFFGGLVLILIGVKILLEHLGVLNF